MLDPIFWNMFDPQIRRMEIKRKSYKNVLFSNIIIGGRFCWGYTISQELIIFITGTWWTFDTILNFDLFSSLISQFFLNLTSLAKVKNLAFKMLWFKTKFGKVFCNDVFYDMEREPNVCVRTVQLTITTLLQSK